MGNNASDNNSCEDSKLRTVVNSIDLIPYVRRLAKPTYSILEVYPYGADNLYPNKGKETLKRSNSGITATETYASFLRGDGFGEELDGLIVNRNGLNLFNLNRHISKDRAWIGFAIHIAYNRFGQITDFTPINFEFVREKVKIDDEEWKMYRVSDNWEMQYGWFNNKFEKDYYAFNPEAAKAQIAKDGFENYAGQLYYWKPTTDIYPTMVADSVLDDLQFEAEAKLYGLSSVQNGYAMGGILRYPANMMDNHANKDFELDIKNNAMGGANAGRILPIPVPPNTTIPNFFEPTTQNNVDSLFTNQKSEAKDNIYQLFRQQSILNGRAESGMFNQDSIIEAFNYYNSITAIDRKDIEDSLNLLFSHSIYKIPKLKIIEKTYGNGDRTDTNND